MTETNLKKTSSWKIYLLACIAALSSWSAPATAGPIRSLNRTPLTFWAHNKPIFSTYAFDMAKDGTVVGYYYDASYNATGYLRKPDGTFVDIVYPAAPTSTFAQRINDSGIVIGNATIAGWNQGWSLNTLTGAFTPIQVPGATATFAEDITEDGTVIGYAVFYPDLVNQPTYFVIRSFILQNGGFAFFDAPKAIYTQARTIDDQGRIAGSYVSVEPDGSNVVHTFVREVNGTFQTIDSMSDLGSLAFIYGMNRFGDTVGTCPAVTGAVWGCWKSGGTGRLTRFSFFEGQEGTNPWQVKNDGTVIGWVYGKGGAYMGFVMPRMTR